MWKPVKETFRSTVLYGNPPALSTQTRVNSHRFYYLNDPISSLEPRVRLSLCELCVFAGEKKPFHAKPAKDAKKPGNPAVVQIRFEVQTDLPTRKTKILTLVFNKG